MLNYLLGGEQVKRAALIRATGATRELIDGMVRKKWITREAVAAPRDARRLETYAVLVETERLPKLNENQQTILATLAGAGGTLPVAVLRALPVPGSTLGTLMRRELIRFEERPQVFHLSGLRAQSFALNTQQQRALESIVRQLTEGGFRANLLYGVTGSGKTAVYMAAMQRALDLDRSAILLVPEIGLTPATAAQLHSAFGDEVAMLHSALTPEERAEQWHRIRRGEASIVVGTRSAMFAPAVRLGLIIVDEEHDSTYKQEENPRYHARDVAVMRAKLAEVPVVLGSATPSLESWHNAERGRYARIEMRERVNQRPLPEVELVDMRKEFRETGQEQIFSRRLIAETEGTLARGEQAIILLNRRGYSFVVMCRGCGEKIRVRELRHLDDVSQAGSGGRCACPCRAAAGVPLLRLPPHGAENYAPSARASTCISLERDPSRASSGCRRSFRSAHRAHGPRYGARRARYGAPADAAAFRRDQSAGRDADDREGT